MCNAFRQGRIIASKILKHKSESFLWDKWGKYGNRCINAITFSMAEKKKKLGGQKLYMHSSFYASDRVPPKNR
jgi:hypothetical protein